MSLFGRKEKAQIVVLKQNLSDIYERAARIQVDFRDVLREFEYYISQYESMRMGARPCIMALKGMLSGLQAKYDYKNTGTENEGTAKG